MKYLRTLPKHWPLWLGGLLVLLLGLRLDVMEVDAAQYASISREMLHDGHWLEVYEHGKTYQSRGFPDKPPLLFWAGAAGMWLFGENNWGFKWIPALVGLLGILAIGRWAALLFGSRAKMPARLFYAFNAGFVLMHQDLRTDAMLVNFILICCWQLEVYLRTRNKAAFFWAFTSLALAMLAKGPVALIAVLAAFGPDALLRRDWKRLWRPEWLLGLVWVLVLLGPMLYGLYTQWGWEKGVKYYFWTQSFGRITGENVWKNDLPVTFLLENFLWAFLPWVPLFVGMLVSSVKQKFRGFQEAGTAVPVYGFTLMLIAMSMSQYKLPHYVFVCWPFAAVWLAGWWSQNKPLNRYWHFGHGLLAGLICLFAGLIGYWTLGWAPYLALVPMVVWLVCWWYFGREDDQPWSRLLPLAWSFVVFECFATGFFYPRLMKYQSSSTAGQWIAQNHADLPVYYAVKGDESLHALYFYSQQLVKDLSASTSQMPEKWILYTDQKWDHTLQNRLACTATDSVVLPYFPVSQLTPTFLNHQTRSSAVEKRYLYVLNASK